MLTKTRGIVFGYTDYSDTSLIARVYTEQFGLHSYMAKGVRSKKSKTKTNLFQPLQTVEIISYHKEQNTIDTIREIKAEYHFTSIHFNISKSSVLLFISEVLANSIREHEQNKPLFEYIHSSIKMLDMIEKGISNFHIIFLAQLTRFLGFYPQMNYSETNKNFDLVEGQFSANISNIMHYVEPPYSFHIAKIFETSFDKLDELFLSKELKKSLLLYLLDYYFLHISGFRNIKSLAILEEVFE